MATINNLAQQTRSQRNPVNPPDLLATPQGKAKSAHQAPEHPLVYKDETLEHLNSTSLAQKERVPSECKHLVKVQLFISKIKSSPKNRDLDYDTGNGRVIVYPGAVFRRLLVGFQSRTKSGLSSLGSVLGCLLKQAQAILFLPNEHNHYKTIMIEYMDDDIEK